MRELTKAVLVALTATGVGCASYTKHGDATLKVPVNFVFEYVSELQFPPIPIGQKGIYNFHVTQLPQIIYPSGFELKVVEGKQDKGKHDQPWRNCVIDAALLAPDGKRFYERRIDFSKDWNGNANMLNPRHPTIFVPFTGYGFPTDTKSLPKYLAYTLRVDVLHPSLRLSDKITVAAHTSGLH